MSGVDMSASGIPEGLQTEGGAARDQRPALDELRWQCRLAKDPERGWLLLRHADVLRALHDHATFSNAVSQHLSVPNGMDPPEHTEYRRVIEPYFARARMVAFEPRCREIAAGLAAAMVDAGPLDFMDAFAGPFAARAQCAFLGWPEGLQESLRDWTRSNQEATRAGDRARLAALARDFEAQVTTLLFVRRETGAGPDADLTTALMHERVHDRALSDDEIVSILRNWTVGEVGTIAAAVGIVAHHLAACPRLQRRLRTNPSLLPAAIEEILRLDGPLAANRRRTACPVEIGGQRIEAGERLALVWIAANRDPEVFEQPGLLRLNRDPADNLLYGAGIHVCPGAPLARLELRVALEELLQATASIAPVPDAAPVRAAWPAAGFERLPLRLAGR